MGGTGKDSEKNVDDRKEFLCFCKNLLHLNIFKMVLWDSGEKERRAVLEKSLILELEQVRLSCLSPFLLNVNVLLAYQLNHL